MTYTKDSYTVQFYIKKIEDGTITRDGVPKLLNLQEVVYSILDAQ